ncbi:CRISPR-associated endonuclease Cas2 [Taylorella equigenitalis]|uniref:CRISPR-associated endonuclease Cas2 n=1 Tax=Taylorella equigenitalis TaxID=29575 RepID=UPI000410D331|nr:CRISPR-associated endonuclease Cas2 [Taylorella equigenitalis]WDU48063.1 CRISPR-associated endonuclease Cas2 [Taylorella equigenitalis]
MLVLITYDVNMEDSSGAKRLRKISNACQNYGVRVQYSVFECDIEPEKWLKLKTTLLKIYDPKKDSLRFYNLGSKWRAKVEHHGSKPSLDIFSDTLIL